MKTAKTTTTTIELQSLNLDDYAIRLVDNLETLDNTEFDLEIIMFELLAQGSPSDIPMLGL